MAAQKRNYGKMEFDDHDENAFLPENGALVNYESADNISPAIRALLTKYIVAKFLLVTSVQLFPLFRIDNGPNCGSKQDEPEPTCTKIYYASRTHSQLSQIIPELSKLKQFPHIRTIVHAESDVPNAEPSLLSRKRPNDKKSEEDEPPRWRAISLGSRKQLCINDELRTKRGDLDEKCRELLGGKSPHLRCIVRVCVVTG